MEQWQTYVVNAKFTSDIVYFSYVAKKRNKYIKLFKQSFFFLNVFNQEDLQDIIQVNNMQNTDSQTMCMGLKYKIIDDNFAGIFYLVAVQVTGYLNHQLTAYINKRKTYIMRQNKNKT